MAHRGDAPRAGGGAMAVIHGSDRTVSSRRALLAADPVASSQKKERQALLRPGHARKHGIATMVVLCMVCVMLLVATACQRSSEVHGTSGKNGNAMLLFATSVNRMRGQDKGATAAANGSQITTGFPVTLHTTATQPEPEKVETTTSEPLVATPSPAEPTHSSASTNKPPAPATDSVSRSPDHQPTSTTPAENPSISPSSQTPRLRKATSARSVRPPTDTTATTEEPDAPAPTEVIEEVLRTRHENFDVSISRARGLIISLHDGIVPLGVSLIKDLRCLGNNELIQVYHCFPNELSSASRDLLLLNETKLEIIDVCSHYVKSMVMTVALATTFRSWWAKPLAMYHTDLQEVILLDADAIPMRDPAVLRSLPGYQRTGTTFFYDRVSQLPYFFNNMVRGQEGTQILRDLIDTFDYPAFNLTRASASSHLTQSFAYANKTCHEMDSSMVAIDKSRATKAMEILWFLITTKRFEYEFSWGDKESFWLAFELAHLPYFFSPWGVSVVSSSTNSDMEDHPDTLCGSLAHFLPVEEDPPELLYVNGKALLDPFPNGIDGGRQANKNQLYNIYPSHVTPRQVRKESNVTTPEPSGSESSTPKFFDECLVGLGSTPLPLQFQRHLLRRRTFYMGIQVGFLDPLSRCDMF